MTFAARSVIGAAAAALVLTGTVAACSQTVEGTAIMAGSPDSTADTRVPSTSRRPSTAPSVPTVPRTTSPRSTASPTPGAPPSGDALTMTCEEYGDLDAAAQDAVVDEILAQDNSVFTPETREVAKSLADAMCQFLPSATVSELLLGTPP